MDDEDLRHSKMVGVPRTEDDIRAGVVRYVRKRFVCGGGCFRMECRHSMVENEAQPRNPLNIRQAAAKRGQATHKGTAKREPNRASAEVAPTLSLRSRNDTSGRSPVCWAVGIESY